MYMNHSANFFLQYILAFKKKKKKLCYSFLGWSHFQLSFFGSFFSSVIYTAIVGLNSNGIQNPENM